MTRRDAIVHMRRCLAQLPARDRARLRYHAEQQTPIRCGDDAFEFWKDGAG